MPKILNGTENVLNMLKAGGIVEQLYKEVYDEKTGLKKVIGNFEEIHSVESNLVNAYNELAETVDTNQSVVSSNAKDIEKIVTGDIHVGVATDALYSYKAERDRLNNIIDETYLKTEDLFLKRGLTNDSFRTQNSTIIGKDSIALGNGNISGSMGYHIRSIDMENKKIYLSKDYPTTETIPTISTEDFTNTDFETPAYTIGEEFSIILGQHYHFFGGKIASVQHNVVTYSGDLPFDTIPVVSLNRPWRYVFFVPSQPEIGEINFAYGGFAEGDNTKALGNDAHSEGYGTIAAGNQSHAEGVSTKAGVQAHSEGEGSIASGETSHAEGRDTTSSGIFSHAEGRETVASGEKSHAEGYQSVSSGNSSHAEGQSTEAVGLISHAEGYQSKALGSYSHAEGLLTTVSVDGYAAHAEGDKTVASNESAHAEGNNTTASGKHSHSEGKSSTASGEASHAEGKASTASGDNAHAEGFTSTASGDCSHSEGYKSTADGTGAHAEGFSKALAGYTHSEGYNTTAKDNTGAHAEGYSTTASGQGSHAEGKNTIASGQSSHAEGLNTVASGKDQHVQGRFNLSDSSYAHIVGNGTSESTRGNAHTLDWSGNAWFAGDVMVGNNKEVLVTKEYIDDKIRKINTGDFMAGKGINFWLNKDENRNIEGLYLLEEDYGSTIKRYALLVGSTTGLQTLVQQGNISYRTLNGEWQSLLQPILISPNGTKFKLMVDDNGNLSTEKIN